MNSQQLQWWNAALEEAQPVDVAEQFQAWSVKDEADLAGLVGEIGWDRWNALMSAAYSWWDRLASDDSWHDGQVARRASDRDEV